jgi:hypothetical protein
MRVNEALGQIAEIHDHLARAEQYRGFHPLAVAGSGLVGLAAAVVQPWLVPADDPAAFVRFWLVVAAVGGGVGVSRAVDAYLRHEDEYARRRTRRVAGQFAPCVVAGLAATCALAEASGDFARCLPGLWTLLFGLGVFAARPYLPHAIGWVALFYLAAGAILLATVPAELAWAGRAVGLTFAVGQVATAFVLRRNRERDADV